MQKSRKNAHLNFTIGTNEFCDYILPFERYVQSITNLEERKRLCDTCKQAIGIRSDTQLWNYRVGNVRPDILKRRELAKIIRRHSGDNSWTADNLFPGEFYNR